LLGSEQITIDFSPEAISRLAELAMLVNEQSENIGARRLHTLMEHLLEDISFNSEDLAGTKLIVDRQYVDSQVNINKLLLSEDYRRKRKPGFTVGDDV